MLGIAFGLSYGMLMEFLERTKELGMLSGGIAYGTRSRIFKMIMPETVFLTIVERWSLCLRDGQLRDSWKDRYPFYSWGEGFEAIGFCSKGVSCHKPGIIRFYYDNGYTHCDNFLDLGRHARL